MRKFLCFSLVLIFVLLPVACYASSDSAILPSTIDVNIVGNDSDSALTLKSVNVSNQRVSASDATGLKAIMLELIGDYETVVTDYVYQSSNGYTSHSITIERDWSWIFSCSTFMLVLFCVFRACGGILKCK